MSDTPRTDALAASRNSTREDALKLSRELEAKLTTACDALIDIADGPQPIEDYKHGIRCGLEDRDLQAAGEYVAAEYGYDKGLDWCADIARRSIQNAAPQAPLIGASTGPQAPDTGQGEKPAESAPYAELARTFSAWASAVECGTCLLDRLDQAQALRAAAEALSRQPVAPAEGVVVPRDPTDKMLQCFGHEWITGTSFDCYRAMLAAAPQPAKVSEDAMDAARYRWLRVYADHVRGFGIEWSEGEDNLPDDGVFYPQPSLDAAIDEAMRAQSEKGKK